MNVKGTLSLLILQVLSRQAAHGYAIAKQIRETSQGVLDYKEGTLYPALHELEHQDVIESYEQLENGRTRRYYRITEKGTRQLGACQTEWKRYTQAVALVMKEAQG